MIKTNSEHVNKVMYEVSVTRAKNLSKDGKTTIAFDMEVNGIKIYSCIYREGIKDGKEWKLIDFPSVKGKDGKYYNMVWFPVSKELVEIVAKAIEAKLK